jgi:predicted O-methyltransferase YrrM
MFFLRIKYMGYLMFSGHRKGHGIHSPFVFDLVSRIMRNKIDQDIVLMIENIRKKNISDDRIISVQDLGGGSSRMKGNLRKVSDIAAYTAVPRKYGRLLSNMASEFGKPDIIELGTSLGISTLYMATACPESKIYTIEGCPATAEIAYENFQKAGIQNINLIRGSFDDTIPELRRKSVKPGLVFIDGNHKAEPTLKYFGEITDLSERNTVIIIDDIHSSYEMEEAWTLIRKHEKVTLTVDIFRMGLIFFREGMNRYNYVIKY